MVHEIQVIQYKTIPSNIKLGTFDSYGTEQLHFTFGSGWKDLAVYATFTAPNGKSTQTAVDLEGYTDVPAEATAGEAGQGEIVLIGKAEGVNRITVTLHYTVLDHGPVQGAEPAVPTPDLLQQVLALSKDAQEAAKNAEQSAANAVKDATNAVKPFKEEAAQAAAGAALSEKSAAESKVAAQKAAGVASQAGIAAGNAADAAEKAAGVATGAAGSSALNAENAQKGAQNAQQSATDAAESQRAAKASADAAEKSRQSAAANAKTAADAKVAAAGSADDAAGSAAAAGNAADDAAESKQEAGASEEKAAASERAAKESEQAAAKSAQAALESKNAAAKSEENAAASAKKAKDIADSLPEDYTTAVNEIAALKTNKADQAELDTVKQQVANITPDDSTVGEKPWSSKNIVDMLCPPLEESGNPVVCYPVAGYPLGIKAKWEPVQEGSGTPYPAGGGKNLWGDLIQNTFISQQGLSSGYPGTKTTGKIPCAEGDKYTLSSVNSFASVPGNIGVIAFFDANDLMLSRVANTYKKAFTVTAPANTAYVRASCYAETNADKVQLEKGSTATEYAPYENIRPIKGRDSVMVERCGENLLKNKGNQTIRGITWSFDDEGFLTINGSIKDNISDYFFFGSTIDNPEAFTAIEDMILSSNYITNNGNNIFGVRTNNGMLGNFGKKEKILIPSGTKVYGVFMRVLNATVDYSGIYAQLEFGSIQTAYKPYRGDTLALTLPSTIYGGEVDAVTGDGNENTKIITLDGTTNKFILSGAFWNLPQNSSPGICNTYDTNCSHFPPGTFGGNQEKGYLFTKPQLMEKYFQDVNAFNAYLAAQYAAGTPVQVCYKLATPVPLTATGTQPIPALEGVNTVLTDADSATVTGRADPIKRITDLETSIASMT